MPPAHDSLIALMDGVVSRVLDEEVGPQAVCRDPYPVLPGASHAPYCCHSLEPHLVMGHSGPRIMGTDTLPERGRNIRWSVTEGGVEPRRENSGGVEPDGAKSAPCPRGRVFLGHRGIGLGVFCWKIRRSASPPQRNPAGSRLTSAYQNQR